MPQTITSTVGFTAPCTPWTMPDPDCCDACDTPEAEALFAQWWEAVTGWLYSATCGRFPGVCAVETEPCPPCGCLPHTYCHCGPWAEIDLSGAFQHDLIVTNGVPHLEFVFPQGENQDDLVLGPDSGQWQLRPDLLTVDWCTPFRAGDCSSSFPSNDHCDSPWTIRGWTGANPPELLLLGASKFVCEIVKDCQGKESCLPDGVRSITRRGLTMDVGPQIEETIAFDTKGTGVPELDIALREWSCDEQPVVAYFDPLARRDQEYRRVWSFRGVLNPTPPSSTP